MLMTKKTSILLLLATGNFRFGQGEVTHYYDSSCTEIDPKLAVKAIFDRPKWVLGSPKNKIAYFWDVMVTAV